MQEYAAVTPKTQEEINHIGETYNDEEKEGEPEKFRQITQINRLLPDKNDRPGGTHSLW